MGVAVLEEGAADHAWWRRALQTDGAPEACEQVLAAPTTQQFNAAASRRGYPALIDDTKKKATTPSSKAKHRWTLLRCGVTVAAVSRVDLLTAAAALSSKISGRAVQFLTPPPMPL